MPVDAGRRVLTSGQSEFPGCCSPGHRFFEKIRAIVEYLCVWKYSTGPVMSHWLSINPDGQRRFFNILNESGILFGRQAYGIRENIFFLGPRGRQFGKTHLTDFKYFVRGDKIRYTSLRHSILTQLAFRHLLTGRDFGERRRFLSQIEIESKDKKVVKIPDILIRRYVPVFELPGWPDCLAIIQNIAVELEAEPKSSTRVYQAYHNHISSITAGRYDRVIYFFVHPRDLKKYRDLYHQQFWPTWRSWREPGAPVDSHAHGALDADGVPRILFAMLPEHDGCRSWHQVI